MRRWLFLLAGPLIWAAHFFGAYAIASIADVLSAADDPWARILVGAFTLACAASLVIVALAALRAWRRRDDDLDRFMASVAGLGAGLSLAAVLWQGLPTLVGH